MIVKWRLQYSATKDPPRGRAACFVRGSGFYSTVQSVTESLSLVKMRLPLAMG
jgi:hypothetical protein